MIGVNSAVLATALASSTFFGEASGAGGAIPGSSVVGEAGVAVALEVAGIAGVVLPAGPGSASAVADQWSNVNATAVFNETDDMDR
jgi:hypothetical protein